jgi:hypothetical protein
MAEQKYDVETVEALARGMCGLCSEKKLRWRDRQYGDFCHQAEPHDTEATECDADPVLQAALKLEIPIDTGTHLEFPEQADT